LLHVSMKNSQVTRQRARLLPAAKGRVLEIGIGSGLNLPHYGPSVTSVDGIDLSPPLLAMASKKVEGRYFPVTLHAGSAEALPFDAGTFDTVVSTWTLCSIADWAAALTEIRRVLKSDGAMLFIEHGRAPEDAVARWQDRLTPIWRRCAGGCHLSRDIAAMVRDTGFWLEDLETGYMIKGPRILTWHYKGVAHPR
jgi:ubiquinone/menaquinone biosynthesis C-methylase UbiE